MTLLSHRVWLIVASLLLTFLSFRAWLHLYPNTDLNVGPYNIHHLFTGILLIALCGIPLAIFQGLSRWLDLAALGFGIGLSLALDEWVFLIATDGSNASYLLRVSLWGGGVMVGLGCLYTLLLWLTNRFRTYK
ncbi:MAG: hypothetical protein ACREEM_05910 [Blastocatellia bacterium]